MVQFPRIVGARSSGLRARFGRPVAVASDRWREGELRDGLHGAGVPLAALSLRGQGYRDGGEDVRLFRRAVAEGRAVLSRRSCSGPPWSKLALSVIRRANGNYARAPRASDGHALGTIPPPPPSMAVSEGVRRSRLRRNDPLRVAVAG